MDNRFEMIGQSLQHVEKMGIRKQDGKNLEALI